MISDEALQNYQKMNDLLLSSAPEYRFLAKQTRPYNLSEQKELWKTLVNVWAPHPIDPEYFKIEDEELGYVNLTQSLTPYTKLVQTGLLKTAIWDKSPYLLNCEALVYESDRSLLGLTSPFDRGFNAELFHRSGLRLRLACSALLKEGEAEVPGRIKVTQGYCTSYKTIFHTVCPIIQNRATDRELRQLENSYRQAMKTAIALGIRSIAIPLLGTSSANKFKTQETAQIAVSVVEEFVRTNLQSPIVVFLAKNREEREILNKLLND